MCPKDSTADPQRGRPASVRQTPSSRDQVVSSKFRLLPLLTLLILTTSAAVTWSLTRRAILFGTKFAPAILA